MCSEQVKSTQPSCDGPKKRSGTSSPISLKDLMEKEVQLSTQDGAIRELLVLADPTNEHSTKIKRKIHILDHPKNLIKVLCSCHQTISDYTKMTVRNLKKKSLRKKIVISRTQ